MTVITVLNFQKVPHKLKAKQTIFSKIKSGFVLSNYKLIINFDNKQQLPSKKCLLLFVIDKKHVHKPNQIVNNAMFLHALNSYKTLTMSGVTSRA